MSPLARYYWSLAGVAVAGLLVWAAGPGRAQLALVIFMLLLGAYAVFVRCPLCRTRLSAMGDSPGVHGLPDRHCSKCGANLGRTAA